MFWLCLDGWFLMNYFPQLLAPGCYFESELVLFHTVLHPLISYVHIFEKFWWTFLLIILVLMLKTKIGFITQWLNISILLSSFNIQFFYYQNTLTLFEKGSMIINITSDEHCLLLISYFIFSVSSIYLPPYPSPSIGRWWCKVQFIDISRPWV